MFQHKYNKTIALVGILPEVLFFHRKNFEI